MTARLLRGQITQDPDHSEHPQLWFFPKTGHVLRRVSTPQEREDETTGLSGERNDVAYMDEVQPRAHHTARRWLKA